jgi:CspA family cold shock protein
MQGKVRFFDRRKGWGFIQRVGDDGPDLFVHHSGIIGQEGFKCLEENDIVTFEIEETEKGPQAVSVMVL